MRSRRKKLREVGPHISETIDKCIFHATKFTKNGDSIEKKRKSYWIGKLKIYLKLNRKFNRQMRRHAA